MIEKISLKAAVNTLLLLLMSATIFHTLILTGVIPYDITWGGRLENEEQMYVFESFSLVVNLCVIAIVSMRGGYIRELLPKRAVTLILYILALLFLLNTIGNLFAVSSLEMMLFTPLTLLSSLFFYRLAVYKAPKN